MTGRMLFCFMAGAAFALGLYLAELEQPLHVLGAFKFGPGWDPRLMTMFLSALAVQWPVTRYLKRRGRTLRGQPLRFVTRAIDRKLVAGSLIFGVGWGLGGICPGPGVTAAFTGGAHVLLFMVAFMAGIRVHDLTRARDDADGSTRPEPALTR